MLIQIKKEKCFSRAGGRQAVVCVSCLVMLLWLMWAAVGCRDNGGATIITGDATEQETLAYESAGTAGFTGQDDPSKGSVDEAAVGASVTASLIYVHVCGQVTNPGVYSLPEGSRVWDAVEAAGGCLPEADPQAVNLAMMVTDGSKVTIPDETEAGERSFRWYETEGGRALTIGGVVGDIYDSGQEMNADSSDGMTAGRIDINRADVSALMTIPGIGQARAEAIVAYRETRGPFGSIEEIMKVTGIKEGLFTKIREYISVGG